MPSQKQIITASLALAIAAISARTSSAALIASYKFNNTSASNVPDDSGNGHTGTFTNGGLYNTADTAPGVGGAGSLDNSFLADLAGSPAFSQLTANNAATILFWSKTANVTQSQFWLENAAHERVFQAHVPWVDGTVYFDTGTGGCCGPDSRLSGASGNDGEWHHWAFVKDGNNKYVYKDGSILIQQNAGEATAAIGTIAAVLIGSTDVAGGNVQAGLMDELAIYSNALTSQEIATIRSNGVPVPEPTSFAIVGSAALLLVRRRRA